MSVSTESFWRQLLFLRRHYRIVSLSEAAELLGSDSSSSPAVSITFDDGYADNFVSLRAVCEELGVPAALFITTVPVELHREFRHDTIRGQHGALPMNWAQIRYWKDRGAEIGSHTRTHIRCGLADRATLQEEIVGSKADFEARLGEAPRFFAFPFGTREDMPPAAMAIAASAYSHFLSACGGENFPGESHGNTHLFRKNAYPEPWELELELQSVFDFVEFAKRKLRWSRRVSQKSFGFPDAGAQVAPGTSLAFPRTPNQFLADPTQAAQPVTKNT